ncbi:unnamed protein product [Rhodiola kirilowii]
MNSVKSVRYCVRVNGPEYAAKYKPLIYLAGSASAEIIADIALCSMEEAVKVRMQTQPGFVRWLPETCYVRRIFWALQGNCSSMGTPDSIYYDEVCLL